MFTVFLDTNPNFASPANTMMKNQETITTTLEITIQA